MEEADPDLPSPERDFIRVMVVEDSRIVRKAYRHILEADSDMRVFAETGDGLGALLALRRMEFDLIILDLEMPIIDGLQVLPRIFAYAPDAMVLVASTLTWENARIASIALARGAHEYLEKPSATSRGKSLSDFQRELIKKSHALGATGRHKRQTRKNKPPPKALPPPSIPLLASPPEDSDNEPQTEKQEKLAIPLVRRLRNFNSPAPPVCPPKSFPSPPKPESKKPDPLPGEFTILREGAASTESSADCSGPRTAFRFRAPAKRVPKVIAIGGSTGAPPVLRRLLPRLAGLGVPIFITQHMPSYFTKLLASQLSETLKRPVSEVTRSVLFSKTGIYLAHGDSHMIIVRRADSLYVEASHEAPVNFCRPSVDPMLTSLIDVFGGDILYIALSGMGDDGFRSARVLVEDYGGTILAQSRESSVIWSMPGTLVEYGMCAAALPAENLGNWCADFFGAMQYDRL